MVRLHTLYRFPFYRDAVCVLCRDAVCVSCVEKLCVCVLCTSDTLLTRKRREPYLNM